MDRQTEEILMYDIAEKTSEIDRHHDLLARLRLAIEEQALETGLVPSLHEIFQKELG